MKTTQSESKSSLEYIIIVFDSTVAKLPILAYFELGRLLESWIASITNGMFFYQSTLLKQGNVDGRKDYFRASASHEMFSFRMALNFSFNNPVS